MREAERRGLEGCRGSPEIGGHGRRRQRGRPAGWSGGKVKRWRETEKTAISFDGPRDVHGPLVLYNFHGPS